jgi:hypothetical protein
VLEENGRTVELHLAGARLVLTDDCENVKAIMFSQVGRTAQLYAKRVDPKSPSSQTWKGEIYTRGFCQRVWRLGIWQYASLASSIPVLSAANVVRSPPGSRWEGLDGQ